MAFIDYEARQIRAKVVWYGPSGGGKTATLAHIFERTRPPGTPGIADRADPGGGSYDVLPLTLGDIRGFKPTFYLHTVPGGGAYSDARRHLLEHVDGIVFTADARAARRDENLRSLAELRSHLAHQGFALTKMPFVVQCTFTDASDALPPDQAAAPLLTSFPEPSVVPVIATVPPQGVGVFDAVKAISRLVLAELKKG